MKKVTVRAPVRADLAGGTLDLWPLYLFHPGSRTVNVAISYYAESEVAETGQSGIEIHLTDQQYERHYANLQEIAADPKAALIHRILEHFHTVDGIRITTRTDAPRGSGLGGSSALSVTLVRAFCELAGLPEEGDDLVGLVRDLETRLLGVPAGIQDYYPPVYGGLAALRLEPGAVRREEIHFPIERLAEHFLLHYTGVAHFSGTNNWEMYKRQIDGDKKVHEGFDRIAQSAIEMERALVSGNIEAAGTALAHEWANRKALIDGISTPEIDAAIDAAVGAGAWAGKVCGAGGGGCIVFLFPKERRDDVRRALESVPGRTLEATPVPHGLTIERNDDAQAVLSFASSRHARRADALEQLYAYGGRSGPYRPFLVAEAVVTQSEPRSGVHQTIVRTYATAIAAKDGTVQWADARVINTSALDLRAVPDEKRKFAARIPPDVLSQSAAQSEEAFRQHVADTETLRIFSNPPFAMFSQPHETREAFLARCMEEANRRLEEEAERLESTFRRRLDQVKERSERDSRQIEARESSPLDEPKQDVNVAWGQALYNITSGKPAAVVDVPHSVREGDYLEKIAQIQKSWERELQTLRDDLTARANEIEEIVIAPAAKSVDISRYLIIWAPRLP